MDWLVGWLALAAPETLPPTPTQRASSGAWAARRTPTPLTHPIPTTPTPTHTRSLSFSLLQSIVRCLGCSVNSYTADPIEDMVLEIVTGHGLPLGSVEAALEHFMAVEELEGA